MKPSVENPLLVGILVDVSASMVNSIQNESGDTTTRLESFRDSLQDLIKRAALLSKGNGERIAPLIKIFAYGFGFGGLLSAIFGSTGSKVRDLLETSFSKTSTVAIDDLASNWQGYKRHVEALAKQMFGDTPMKEGFQRVLERFREELRNNTYSDEPVLFVLSDGAPTDSANNEIVKLADMIKGLGVTIISCYITDENITSTRTLYSHATPDWPNGAELMLESSSTLPENSSFSEYLTEFNWKFDSKPKLFSQINQSEVLSEFMQMILSPLEQGTGRNKKNRDQTKVFISYSHQDSKYMERKSLLGFLKGLERDGFEFWYDEDIFAGDNWDEEIKANIESSDIALVLVSQAFLNSKYCMDVEIEAFLDQRRNKGLTIFPVIISPCDWKSHEWLSSTQFEPRGGKTIERDFNTKGKRDELFLSIYEQLREISRKK